MKRNRSTMNKTPRQVTPRQVTPRQVTPRLTTRRVTTRRGMTLLEVMAALVIAASVATLAITYLRPAAESSQQRSCDLCRELLQNDVQRYLEAIGRPPSNDLRELRTSEHAGATLPTCPTTGQSYRLGRGSVVACPTHEATRSP